jgi:excisionase family DNA binding protein
MNQIQNLWDYKDLADFLKCGPDKLRRQVMNRQIPFIKIGRLVRFKPEEVQNWLASQSVSARGGRNG